MLRAETQPRALPGSEAHLRSILDSLDEGGAERGFASGFGWIGFRQSGIPLTVEHVAGGTARFSVWTRRLSSKGACFLNGGFLHPGTRCTLTLPTVWRSTEAVSGRVVDCRHVNGPIHGVDIEFEKKIDLRHFVDRDNEEMAAILAAQVAPMQLGGDVLLLASSPAVSKVVAHGLNGTKVRLTAFTEAGRALDELRKRPFDLVLLNVQVSGADKGPGHAIDAVREAGFVGPVVLLSGETNAARLATGVSAVVRMPFDGEALVAALSEWLASGGAEASTEPIHSGLASTPGMGTLIEEYITIVKEVAHGLKQAQQKLDSSEARRLCNILNETGGCYGFPEVSEAAANAMVAIDASGSVGETSGEVQRLLRVCQRLAPGAPGGGQRGGDEHARAA